MANGGLHFTGDAATAREVEFVAGVRAALHLPHDAPLSLDRVLQDDQGGHVLEYSTTVPVTLGGEQFGTANGVSVDEAGIARVKFNASGALVSAEVTPADPRHLQLVQDQVKKLAAADQIARAREQAPGKPWYVETEKDGRKRLKRSFIA